MGDGKIGPNDQSFKEWLAEGPNLPEEYWDLAGIYGAIGGRTYKFKASDPNLAQMHKWSGTVWRVGVMARPVPEAAGQGWQRWNVHFGYEGMGGGSPVALDGWANTINPGKDDQVVSEENDDQDDTYTGENGFYGGTTSPDDDPDTKEPVPDLGDGVTTDKSPFGGGGLRIGTRIYAFNPAANNWQRFINAHAGVAYQGFRPSQNIRQKGGGTLPLTPMAMAASGQELDTYGDLLRINTVEFEGGLSIFNSVRWTFTAGSSTAKVVRPTGGQITYPTSNGQINTMYNGRVPSPGQVEDTTNEGVRDVKGTTTSHVLEVELSTLIPGIKEATRRKSKDSDPYYLDLDGDGKASNDASSRIEVADLPRERIEKKFKALANRFDGSMLELAQKQFLIKLCKKQDIEFYVVDTDQEALFASWETQYPDFANAMIFTYKQAKELGKDEADASKAATDYAEKLKGMDSDAAKRKADSYPTFILIPEEFKDSWGLTKYTGDCNDEDADVKPANATEAARACVEAYIDADKDTYGQHDFSARLMYPSNLAALGFVENNSDCNDSDPAINPSATEVPGNDVDENCDGSAPKEADVSSQLDRALSSLIDAVADMAMSNRYLHKAFETQPFLSEVDKAKFYPHYGYVFDMHVHNVLTMAVIPLRQNRPVEGTIWCDIGIDRGTGLPKVDDPNKSNDAYDRERKYNETELVNPRKQNFIDQINYAFGRQSLVTVQPNLTLGQLESDAERPYNERGTFGRFPADEAKGEQALDYMRGELKSALLKVCLSFHEDKADKSDQLRAFMSRVDELEGLSPVMAREFVERSLGVLKQKEFRDLLKGEETIISALEAKEAELKNKIGIPPAAVAKGAATATVEYMGVVNPSFQYKVRYDGDGLNYERKVSIEGGSFVISDYKDRGGSLFRYEGDHPFVLVTPEGEKPFRVWALDQANIDEADGIMQAKMLLAAKLQSEAEVQSSGGDATVKYHSETLPSFQRAFIDPESKKLFDALDNRQSGAVSRDGGRISVAFDLAPNGKATNVSFSDKSGNIDAEFESGMKALIEGMTFPAPSSEGITVTMPTRIFVQSEPVSSGHGASPSGGSGSRPITHSDYQLAINAAGTSQEVLAHVGGVSARELITTVTYSIPGHDGVPEIKKIEATDENGDVVFGNNSDYAKAFKGQINHQSVTVMDDADKKAEYVHVSSIALTQ